MSDSPRISGAILVRHVGRAAVVVAIIVLAAGIYQPGRNAGFDIEDFSEFRPLLEQNSGLVNRVGALERYYETLGRWNIAAYWALAAKWTLVGPDVVVWQTLRFLQMLLVAGLVYWVLRRFRLGHMAAMIGAVVFIFSSPAAASFNRLTLGEPLAMTMLLLAILLGQRYQEAAAWPASALCIAALLGLVVAAKEVLVVSVPFAVACGIGWTSDGWQTPQWSRRNLGLVAAVTLVVGLIGVKVLWVAVHATGEPYTSLYGAGERLLERLLAIVGLMILPVHRTAPPMVEPPNYPANILFVVLLIASVILWWRNERPSNRTAVIAWLALPVLGAVVYVPWPRFEEFYALPFQFGVVLLLTWSVDHVAREDRARALLTSALFATAVAFMVVTDRYYTEIRVARRALNQDVTELLQTTAGMDSVLVVSSGGGRFWTQHAATLARVAYGGQVAGHPPVLGLSCTEKPSVAGLPSTVLVIQFARDCGAVEGAELRFSHLFSYRDWRTFEARADSQFVHVSRGRLPDRALSPSAHVGASDLRH